MLADTRRYLLIIALLLGALVVAWRRPGGGQAAPAAPADQAVAAQPGGTAATLPGHIYFVDVEGWYRITPHETAVRSPFDLAGGSTAAVAGAIPARLGGWQQAGPDQDVSADPAVIEFLGHPTVALQRTYRDASGQALVLTVLANTGQDSYLLFSHTPETCFPGLLWQVVDSRLESALLDDRPMHAQYLLTEHAETRERMLVLFWYLWADAERDPAAGVTSMRVSAPIPAGQTEQAVLDRAWDLIRQLFPATAAWERF